MSYDDIYKTSLNQVDDFAFNENVTSVFANMIVRSVPGYLSIVEMIAMLAKEYVQKNTVVYDLGASLGTVSLAVAEKIPDDVKIIAVDCSKPMTERCCENTGKYDFIEVQCEDISNLEIKNASFVILNFTLQFIPREKREGLLAKIYHGMVSGGVLILSEKVSDEDQENRELQIRLHENFKRLQGYSMLEIEQKKTALHNVMLLDTIKQHQQRLAKVGFNYNKTWFQCFNFISMFAQK